MQIAVTHANTDFDALASLVAATYLYPGTIGVLPGQLRPNVKHFLVLHKDLFKIRSIREVDLESVTGLIAVDTNHWGRLDRLAPFSSETISPSRSPREALRIMTEADTGILPVIEDNRLVGVITRADLLLHIYAF